MNESRDVPSYGIAWDAFWIGPDRLRVRGWRARSGPSVLARWDLDALIATIDVALEAANWTTLARQTALAAVHELCAADLAPI